MTQAFNHSPTSAEERFRLLFNAQSDCVFHIAGNGMFLDVNKTACKVLGYSREELLSASLDLLVPGDSLQDSYEKIRQLRRGEQIPAYRKRFRTKDGRLIPFEVNVSATVDDNGNLIIQSICRDLRRELATERRLKSTEYLLQTLVESAVDAIWVKDVDGRFTLINPAMVNFFQMSAEQILGRTVAEIFPPDQALRSKREDNQVLLEGKTVAVENPIQFGDRNILLHMVKAPLRDADGRIIGMLGIGRDMTKERMLTRQLQQAQKLEAIGSLAGGISHDFNNLLTGIIGNLSLGMDKLPQNDDVMPFFHAAFNAAESASRLTRQLLQISRRQPTHKITLNLGDVVQEVLNLLRSTFDRRIKLEQHIQKDLWQVMADKTQIQQVLMNLCLNARDALAERYGSEKSPKEGMPWCQISAENIEINDRLTLRWGQLKPGRYIRFTVSDNGTGIAPDVIDRIYEPFFTTKPKGKGTGLGVPMVYSIVANHGGWMTVESELGIGTDVIVYFPQDSQPATVSAEPQLSLANIAGDGKTVLLVEDENTIRDLLKRLLTDTGYQVHEATNGAEGYAKLRELFPNVDLIVLDLIMPVMSGQEFLRSMQEEGLNVPVLVCSGYTGELTKNDLLELGAQDFLDKPFTPIQFLHKIGELLPGDETNSAD